MKHDSNCELHHLAVRLQNNDFITRRVYTDSVFITNMLITFFFCVFFVLFCFVLSLTVQEPTPDPTTPPTPTAPPTIPPGWAGKPLMTSIIHNPTEGELNLKCILVFWLMRHIAAHNMWPTTCLKVQFSHCGYHRDFFLIGKHLWPNG